MPDDKKRRVGIYVAPKSTGTGEVHLTDADKGETILVLPEHPHANIEPADYEDIPTQRRPAEPGRYPRRAKEQQQED